MTVFRDHCKSLLICPNLSLCLEVLIFLLLIRIECGTSSLTLELRWDRWFQVEIFMDQCLKTIYLMNIRFLQDPECREESHILLQREITLWRIRWLKWNWMGRKLNMEWVIFGLWDNLDQLLRNCRVILLCWLVKECWMHCIHQYLVVLVVFLGLLVVERLVFLRLCQNILIQNVLFT